MPATRHITPRNGDVLLLVGTLEGSVPSSREQATREVGDGRAVLSSSAVYAVALDGRAGRHRIWAGPHSTATCLPLRRAGLGAGAVAAAFTMAQKIGRLAPPPAPRSPGRERRAERGKEMAGEVGRGGGGRMPELGRAMQANAARRRKAPI